MRGDTLVCENDVTGISKASILNPKPAVDSRYSRRKLFQMTMAGPSDILIKEIGAALEADRESIHPAVSRTQ